MTSRRIPWTLAVLLCACGAEAESDLSDGDLAPAPAVAAPADDATAASQGPTEVESPSAPRPPGAAPDSLAVPLPPAVPMPGRRPAFDKPENIRGLYVNAWAAGSTSRIEALIAIAKTTEVNAFVIDVKDATGYVSYASGVPAVRASGALGELRIRDLPGLLARLEEEAIYPIARIVIMKDPILTAARPDLAVQDSSGGVWGDDRGVPWLNPHHRDVWEYHISLAEEAAALGFPEIQWDYVRFPDADAERIARTVYPGSEGQSKAETVRSFLVSARERLDSAGVRMTADVFGITTSTRRDIGIGQVWERFVDAVDAAQPMVYPSHYYTGSFGHVVPNAYPYEIVRAAVAEGVERSETIEGAGEMIPWLQDFTLGRPRYGAAEVRAQIQAAYDAGTGQWLLWNASSRYTVGALEPAEGFSEEPSIRVADVLVPVSLREEVVPSEGPPPSPGRSP